MTQDSKTHTYPPQDKTESQIIYKVAVVRQRTGEQQLKVFQESPDEIFESNLAQ